MTGGVEGAPVSRACSCVFTSVHVCAWDGHLEGVLMHPLLVVAPLADVTGNSQVVTE